MINKNSQKIFNNSIFYSLGTIASKATSFILLPVYTYNLTSEQYGIATTITTFVTTFGILMMLSLRAAIIRFFNDYDDEKRRLFIGTITTTVAINSLIICIALCLFRNFYVDIFFKGIDFFPYVFLGIISLGTEGIYLVYQSVLQAKQAGGLYSLNSFIYLAVHAVFVIVLLTLKLNILGFILANTLTNVLFAIYGIIDMRRRKLLIFGFDKGMFFKSIKYSLPILPHNMANDLNTYSVKVIISNYLNYSLSGIYTLASQFSSVVNMVQSSINLAFRPWFMEQMKLGQEGRSQIKYMTCMIMSLFCFVAVSVCAFSREIIMIFAPKQYINAWSIIPAFVFAQLITFIYYSHIQTMMYNLRMSKFSFVCSVTGLLANIVFSVLLSKSLGIYGIVLAQIIAKGMLAFITVVFSNYAENVDFGLPKMIFDLLGSAVLMVMSMILATLIDKGLSLWLSLLLRIVVILIAFILYIYKYLTDYKALCLGMIKKKG